MLAQRSIREFIESFYDYANNDKFMWVTITKLKIDN